MLLIANLLLLSLSAQSSSPNIVQENIAQSVKVVKKKNPGDLPYDGFYKNQERLIAYLPNEPRTIDFSNRVSFNDMERQARDDYSPQTWGVAIVGDSVDYVVPMIRGGYFVLPNSPEARQEKAKILFNTTTQKNFLKTAWVLRLSENTLSYKDFARSFDEVKQLQEKIRWYELNLKDEKNAKFDALKACFMESGGQILLDDTSAETLEQGRCISLKFDKEKLALNPKIKFVGTLEIVTLANTQE
nr:hypothetical protein [uncultured Undibacterium sp.]